LNEPEALRTLLQYWKSTSGYNDSIRIKSARRNSNGSLNVQASFGRSQTLVLQQSSDLKNWIAIRTNLLDPTASATWDLDAASINRTGFFRVVAPE
jgi:hypothetical protein